MSSKSVSTTVAKKLKYYLDVKRREDAFDLSGPYLPKEDPTPLRAGPTLAYDGIHDRSLKHYFRRNSIKKHLQHMTVPAMMSKSREKAIRRYVDETMATVDYRLKPGPISPYAFPQTFKPQPPPQRPKALRTVDEYFRTRKGSKRRKMPVHVVGKPRRIARSSPPEHIHNYERERLVNMASKLIVATETVALPQQKKQSKGFQTSGNEFPSLERSSKSTGSSTSGHESEGSINGRTPMPPRQRPQSSFFKSSSLDETGRKGKSGVHVVVPDSSENEKLRFLMDRMNLDGRGSSIVISPREIEKPRPKSAGYPLKSTANMAVETDLPDYSDDDFCSDEESSPRESARTPRLSWVENKESDMIDTCTQTVVHSATQTKFPEYDQEQGEREFVFPSKLHWADRGQLDQTDGRQPVVIATTGASTSDVLTSGTSTSASHETQTRNRDLEPTVITYEVYVQTGDRLGAGSKVNVKITIFGEYGNSGERQLLRSKTHRNKFQRGQVDVFAVDSLFLGKLQSIRIGHSETRLGYGWFLDKVYIKEGQEATRAFEFRCNRWFSSRDDDGQIMRDLPRYDTVPASHADAILPKEKERKEELYSPSDSETSKSDSEESPREKEKASRKKTKQKSKKKSKKTEKQEAKKQEFEPLEELGGIRGAKAENIFEVSEEDDQDQDENENEDRFFEPEEESESEQSEDEKIVNRKPEEEKSAEKIKPPKYPNLGFAVKTKRYAKKNSKVKDVKEEDDENKDKRKLVEDEPLEDKESEENEEARESHDENNNSEEGEEKESEEKRDEKDEESPKEEESNKPKKIAGSHLRVVTTAISPFLKSRQAAQPSPIAEEPSETSEDNQTKEKEEDSDEDEPKVEFTSKNEKKSDERPSSAKSDEFEEGFRAGIRKKQEDERKRHRASISESENVLKKGSSIHEAAKNGNLERIKELIQVVPAIKSTQDERGMTALHLAASNGHLNCVKWLAVSGVDLADETPTGYTAMHLAAMNGHVNCMMILAAMGSAISCKTIDSLTPLHLASMSGHFECVKWLLANRARMDVEDSNGRTPLDIAEEYEHEPIIKLLKKFKKELTRQDSTLAQLMTAEKRRKSMDSTSDNEAAPSKVSDSGVGGMESEEDNWISDTEEDAAAEVVKNEDKASTRKASTHSITDQEPSSRSRTDSIVSAEEKKKMFEMQRRKMKKRHSSFLDSIRMDVDNDDEF